MPLDPRCVARNEELAHFLAVSHPTVLIVDDEAMSKKLGENYGGELASNKLKAMMKSDSNQGSISSETWPSYTEIPLNSLNHKDAPAKKTAMDQATDDENAIALLIFTSGTPSLPKACPHTRSLDLHVCHKRILPFQCL